MKRNIDVIIEKVAAFSKETFEEFRKRINAIDTEKVKENLKEAFSEVCEVVKDPEEVRTSKVVEAETVVNGNEAVVETSEVKEDDPDFTKFCSSFKMSDADLLTHYSLAGLTLEDLAAITVIKSVVFTGFKSRKSLITFVEKRMAETGLDKEYTLINPTNRVDMMLRGLWDRDVIKLWQRILGIEAARLEWEYKGPLPEEDEVLEDEEGEIGTGLMRGFINLME